MAICDICKIENNHIILSGSKYYCEMCWYYKNAPVLMLTKTWDREPLFNPKLNKYVFPTNNQLEVCGFKLFNKKIFFNRKTNPSYREILIYKYSGKLRCLAFTGYKAWPTKMKTCCMINCTLY